jgi:hypothetical protein
MTVTNLCVMSPAGQYILKMIPETIDTALGVLDYVGPDNLLQELKTEEGKFQVNTIGY